jgi:hypothetical protein
MSTSISTGPPCYGQLTILSDVDDGGFALNVDNKREVLLCYNKASTTEPRDKHTRWRYSAESSTRGCIEEGK